MKFDFNTSFLKSLSSLLDSREELLKKEMEANYVHVDDTSFSLYEGLENITEKLSNLERIIENSELEFKDFNDYVEKDEILEYLEHEIDERSLISSSDLQEAFENSHLESRINDLENLTFSQKQNDDNSNEIEVLKERLLTLEKQEFAQEILKRVLTLENDNQESKERILTLENFILKTLKGFK